MTTSISGGGAGRQGVGTQVIYDDGRVRVVSDEALPRATAVALAHKVERFYDWDARQEHWKNPRPLAAPLTVAAVSREQFTAVTGDPTGSVGGFTTGPNLFVVPADSLARRSADDDVVVAHELAHVQDFREAGSRLNRVPIYLQEGKAYLLGDQGAMTGGVEPRNVEDVSRALSRITGEDAQSVMQGFRRAADEGIWGRDGFYGETIGALYVEFLRLHFQGGHADAIPRLADTITAVGQGAGYESAFKQRFGASSKETEQAFVRWVQQTEGRPEARLGGTIYDPQRSRRAA